MGNKIKVRLIMLLMGAFLISCAEEKSDVTHENVNWENRKINLPSGDSLIDGQTYLSVYSQIYSQSERNTKDLTVTVSMRNTDANNQLFIIDADYYNTKGDLIKSYFDEPIYIDPMETVEIIIDETDQLGGTGGNFIFDWKMYPTATDPSFEAVMISTAGQQGLSFVTIGRRIK